MQPKKEKTLNEKNDIQNVLSFIKKSKLPYEIRISNYTTELISDLFTKQFMESMRSKKCFVAYNKVKSDVSKIEVPVINKDELMYFFHNFNKDIYIGNVINIDLKSAYANALFVEKMISDKTFKYLQSIPKLDRLASVGMLASKKHIFTYDENNKIIEHKQSISELENFFYHAVFVVQNIMTELMIMFTGNYLFTWVDGIYLRTPRYKELMQATDYLKSIGFKYTIESLTEFNVEVESNGVNVSYIKDNEAKSIYIPSMKSNLAKDLINLIISKNKSNGIIRK